MWRRLRENQHYSEILTAALYVAACGMHLQGCVGIRAGRAVRVLEGISGLDSSESWYHQVSGTQRFKPG
eukprot:2372432-Karenia_brevis.AAC.1